MSKSKSADAEWADAWRKACLAFKAQTERLERENEELTKAFEWLRKNAPVSIRYMTGNEQWSLPPAYCVLVKDRLFYGTTVFHAVREAMLSEP